MQEQNSFDKGAPILIKESKLGSKSLKHPHQINAVNALTEYFELDKNKIDRKGLLVMPTGSGKTYTSVYWLMTEAVAHGYTIIWVVHRTELVEQTYLEFIEQTALLKGCRKKFFNIILVSGMHMKMAEAYNKDVYILSRQSAANPNGIRYIDDLVGNKKKVIMVIDEAHHAVASQYQEIWKRIKAKAKYAILLGLTATPTRINEKSKEELLRLFNVDKNIAKNRGSNGFVYQITMSELLKSGFLAKPIPVQRNTKIDAVKTYHITEMDFSDFGDKDLTAEALNRIAENEARNKFIINEYETNLKDYLKDKKETDFYGKTIVFAINIEHAKHLCNLFNNALKKYSIRAEYIASGKPGNQEILQEFKANSDPTFKILINVQILTEGSDVPDVKTVFLTRQTSSDVMLMQMIGRALRGEDAGGTPIAYIVAFIDNWKEKYDFWMNPSDLDIFKELEEAEETDETVQGVEEMPEICAREFPQLVVENEDGDLEIPVNEPDGNLTDWEALYQKIYNEISLEGNCYEPIEKLIPVGWYALDYGFHWKKTLIAYDKQLDDYKNVELNIPAILRKYNRNRNDALREKFNKEYFHTMNPSIANTTDLLAHITLHGKMPTFFSFEESEKFNPLKLAQLLKENKSQFPTVEKRQEWLKQIYTANPVLQNIYESLGNFKKTVLDAMRGKQIAIVKTELLKKKPYKIVDNYYNLYECLQEVLDSYPKLNANGLLNIQWSDKIPRHWFALCQRSKDNKRYQITVSKICSSPYVSKELVKYLIFHELLHKNGYWKHDKDFRSLEWQFKKSVNHDRFLDGVLNSVYDLSEYEKMSPKRIVIKFQEKNETGPVQDVYSTGKIKRNLKSK